MILIDKPYISDFLKQTIIKNNYPVFQTTSSKGLNNSGLNLLSEDQAIEILKNNKETLIYTNSENSIGWIAKNLDFTDLPQKIDLFKDKVKFRDLLKPIYPDFYYKGLKASEIMDIDVSTLSFPFVIKPAAGFFSMGVYKVRSIEEWEVVKKQIMEEKKSLENIYPQEVMNSEKFIIEQCLEGVEFAVDGYFNKDGEAVVLNILKHLFSGNDDVSDRVYVGSKKIIESHLESFTKFIQTVGNLGNIKDFPVHVELILNDENEIIPIEINPMRFGGWCTTADLGFSAYGINQYECFFSNTKPDFDKAFKGKENYNFSLIVLDNSTGIDSRGIKTFDYEKLLSGFKNPLELRKIDFKEYPVFGFVFTKNHEDEMEEVLKILHSDLVEFIKK